MQLLVMKIQQEHYMELLQVVYLAPVEEEAVTMKKELFITHTLL